MYQIIPFSSSSENAIHTREHKFSFVFNSEKSKEEMIATIYQSMINKGHTLQNKINNLHLVLKEIFHLYSFIRFVIPEDYENDKVKVSEQDASLAFIDQMLQTRVFSVGELTKDVLYYQLEFKQSFVNNFLEEMIQGKKPLIDLSSKLELKTSHFNEYDLISDNACLFSQVKIADNRYYFLDKKERVHQLSKGYWKTDVENMRLRVCIKGKTITYSPAFMFDMSEHLSQEQFDKLALIEEYGNLIEVLEEKIIDVFDSFADKRFDNPGTPLSTIIVEDLSKISLLMDEFEEKVKNI